ncbi:hypothetical protein [Nocardia rhamnosiphila]
MSSIFPGAGIAGNRDSFRARLPVTGVRISKDTVDRGIPRESVSATGTARRESRARVPGCGAYSTPEREHEFFTDLFPVVDGIDAGVRESVRIEFSGQ